MKNLRRQFLPTYSISIALSLLAFSPSSFAQMDDELEDLSLEDLLNLTVTVASKKAENLADAPGIVTVYSHKDIDRTGYYTLAQLADITAGYSTNTSGGNTRFETRGQTDPLNAKHLLLIDGIPANHARDYMAFTQEQLPLHFAQQVEFLRGPASALYGVSAFFGVVNIRSKDLQEEGTLTDVSASTGSLDGEQRLMGNMINKNENGRFRLAFGYYQKDASLAKIPVADPQRNFLRDQNDSLFANASYRIDTGLAEGLSMGMIYMSKESGFGESWNGGVDTSEVSVEKREVAIPYLKYERELNEDISVNGYIKYNRSTEFGTQSNEVWGSPFIFQFNAVTDNTEYLAELVWQVSEESSLIVGANLDRRGQDDGESFLFNPFDPNNGDAPFFAGTAETTSLYAQYSHQIAPILKGLNVTVGGRYDEGSIEENEYTQFSPRLGLVQKLTDEFNIKLLWGNALKAPGVKEVGHNSEKSVTLIDPANSPNVDPETIETKELSLVYTTERVSASLTYFDTLTEDQILESPIPTELYIDSSGDVPGFFQNRAGETKTDGWEVDVRAAPIAKLWLIANLSLTDTEDPQGNELVNSPKTKLNLGASYEIQKATATVLGRYVDEYTSSDGVTAYDGQTVFDVNLRYPLSDAITASLKVTNLFDEEYFQANNGSDGLPQPGREFLVTVSGSL